MTTQSEPTAQDIDWLNQHRRKIPLLDAVLMEMERQDHSHGWFESNAKGLRLAVAALEDEAEETRHAWRAERKRDGWPQTITEAVQTAAVALRLARDAAQPDGSFM